MAQRWQHQQQDEFDAEDEGVAVLPGCRPGPAFKRDSVGRMANDTARPTIPSGNWMMRVA